MDATLVDNYGIDSVYSFDYFKIRTYRYRRIFIPKHALSGSWTWLELDSMNNHRPSCSRIRCFNFQYAITCDNLHQDKISASNSYGRCGAVSYHRRSKAGLLNGRRHVRNLLIWSDPYARHRHWSNGRVAALGNSGSYHGRSNKLNARQSHCKTHPCQENMMPASTIFTLSMIGDQWFSLVTRCRVLKPSTQIPVSQYTGLWNNMRNL